MMIAVVDNTPPTIVGVPDDVTVSCDSVPPADRSFGLRTTANSPGRWSPQDSIVPGSRGVLLHDPQNMGNGR